MHAEVGQGARDFSPVRAERRPINHCPPLPALFMGVLHASRSFEHKLDSGEVIRGKADPSVELSTLVNWDLKPWS